MPALGADTDSATLVAWRVAPGAPIKRGEIIAEVATEKGNLEVDVFESGVVDALLVAPGTRVRVGAPMARIRTNGGLSTAPGDVQASEAGVHASPAARRLAMERGIVLRHIIGTGMEGAITMADVERAAAAKAALQPEAPAVAPAAKASVAAHSPVTAPPPDVRIAAMRHAVAAAMSRSKREIPHYYLGTEVDVSRMLRWLDHENRARPVSDRILPGVMLMKAVARALHDVPELNGFWIDDRFHQGAGVHLGVAISLRGGGLVAPAIHDADTLSTDALMRALRDVVQRARGGMLRTSELTDPTATVTNLGDMGVSTVFGVIHPPQVALIGLGRIIDRPWADQGMLGVRPVVSVTLSADHRASDGHRGGRLLTMIDQLLQAPHEL